MCPSKVQWAELQDCHPRLWATDRLEERYHLHDTCCSGTAQKQVLERLDNRQGCLGTFALKKYCQLTGWSRFELPLGCWRPCTKTSGANSCPASTSWRRCIWTGIQMNNYLILGSHLNVSWTGWSSAQSSQSLRPYSRYLNLELSLFYKTHISLTNTFWAGSPEGSHCWWFHHLGARCHWAQSLGCLQALQQHYLWGSRLGLNRLAWPSCFVLQ